MMAESMASAHEDETRKGQGAEQEAGGTEDGRRIWLAALGIAPAAAEGAGWLFETLVEKGRAFEAEGTGAFGDLGRKFSSGMETAKTRIRTGYESVEKSVREFRGKSEEAIDRKVETALKRAGMPTRDEVGDLIQRLDRISAKVDEIATRQSGGNPDSRD